MEDPSLRLLNKIEVIAARPPVFQRSDENAKNAPRVSDFFFFCKFLPSSQKSLEKLYIVYLAKKI